MQMISSNFLKVGISSKKIVLVFDWAWTFLEPITTG